MISGASPHDNPVTLTPVPPPTGKPKQKTGKQFNV